MTIFTRRLALSDRKLFFVIGVLSYFTIGFMGFIYSIVFGHGLPDIPSGKAWLFIVAEGFFIPAAWLLQYKIISKLGASNAVIITTANNAATAFLGFIFLKESFSPLFIVGSVFILGGIVTVLRIQPDMNHRETVPSNKKLLMILVMLSFYAFGMLFEKKAIDLIGVWNYACFGWGMQFVGALAICVFYGREEIVHITATSVRKGLLLGLMTSVAGGLYIYALSIGSLSHTVVAASGKIAITMLLAALILRERNALRRRIIAFALVVVGLYFLLV